MNKINILDSTIFNRIAAGEVVERPYSVLKELLDNSIDAKASEISINVLEGGIKQIEVIDNGQGIEFDDLPRVFLPHATSKIKTVDDLDKIGTLGFRGEALASIGAVSEVTLISKPQAQENAGKLTISGGKMGEIMQVGGVNGTAITVNNIFFNVPARAKFLKKTKQEAGDITNLVARYILTNPTIKIKYTLDGKEVYSSTGNGLFEAIYTVYGKQTTDQILKVDYQGTSNIKVSGYVGMPTFSKPNRTYQTLSINGRYVVNSMVSLCVYNAFEHYLMKGQFPFFVLNLEMPVDSLDVNVHPNKMDVRFENNNTIYGVVYQAVANALEEHSRKVVEVNKKVFDFAPVGSSGVSFITTLPSKDLRPIKITTDAEQNIDSGFTISKEEEFKEQPNLENSKVENNKVDFYEGIASSSNQLKQSSSIMTNLFDDILEEDRLASQKSQTQTSFLETPIKYIGTVFDTYLIVQEDDDCYFIDQHAAHERILFDKLVEQMNKHELGIQSLLVPFVLTVNNIEKQFLDSNLDNLKELGFDIAEFGNMSYKVSTVPTVLAGINLKEFFDSVLSDLLNLKSLKKSDLILTKLMQHSCKTAVKAGDRLNDLEVKSLLKQIRDNGMVLQCPHGRPVVVKVARKELERWFKRVV